MDLQHKNDFISFYSSAVIEDAEGLTDPSVADLSSEFLCCSSLKVSQLIVCNSAWPEQGLPLPDLRQREAEKSGFSTDGAQSRTAG